MLVAVALVPSVAQGAVLRDAFGRYDAAVTGPFAGFQVPAGSGRIHLGGVRFDVTAADRSVFLAVFDDVFGRVAARYLVTDGAGKEVASGDFCDRTTAALPAGSVVLWVFPSTIVTPCALQTPSGPAVRGSVYAAFMD